MKKINKIIIILFSISCLSILIYRGIWDYNRPENFDDVVPGAIYRSSLPTVRELDYLVKKYSIRSVVMLSGDVTPKYNRIFKYIRENNLKFFHDPIGTSKAPSYTNALEFLEFVEATNNQPLLVHCAAGADRTGWMIMIYRIATCDWEWEDALAEFENYGGNYKGKKEIISAVKDIATRLDNVPHVSN